MVRRRLVVITAIAALGVSAPGRGGGGEKTYDGPKVIDCMLTVANNSGYTADTNPSDADYIAENAPHAITVEGGEFAELTASAWSSAATASDIEREYSDFGLGVVERFGNVVVAWSQHP